MMENESFKARLYWFIMNVSESVFMWARERWSKETRYVWYRPNPIQREVWDKERTNLND